MQPMSELITNFSHLIWQDGPNIGEEDKGGNQPASGKTTERREKQYSIGETCQLLVYSTQAQYDLPFSYFRKKKKEV